MELTVLVRLAQAGNEQAVCDICERFTGLVKKHAYQAHVRGFAEEAVAQGWLEVVQGIRQYDETSGIQFAGYIESRVKYGIWNLFKRERRRWEHEAQLDGGGEDENGLSMLELLADGADVAGEVERRWIAEELIAAVKTLPSTQGQVIVRTVLGHEKLATIGMELGITPQGVYNLRQRGFNRLKRTCAGMY